MGDEGHAKEIWFFSGNLATLANYWHPLASLPAEGLIMPDEILTLPEVAILLKIAEKTVYTMVQKAQFPAFKVGGQWRFKRVDIDRWIEQQKAEPRKEGKS
jgi:excisionase family DNA binding protein